MYTAFIALGSNLNNPQQQIINAIDYLRQQKTIDAVVCSSLYHSKPQGPQDQPNFINACCRCQTCLQPIQLLDCLQSIEEKAQRVKKRLWGERSLDLDIISIHDSKKMIQQKNERLQLPHPLFEQRDFVLYPLKEVLNECWQLNIDHLLKQLPETFLIKDHKI